ncbi:hypothetical protein M514_02171 [Trichuris suis]|uniref:Uncharacterized protein n=1 Tax=Trichuris suis TaxID=68888 RepID=A0A085N9K8_9BILA|nr:hypothetical protein M513_02171 [Trichuris suis]KFD66154.1 hypothetical protein M514_02171 [Trichuris suis]
MEAVPCTLRSGNSLPVYGLLIRQVQHQQVLQSFKSPAINGTDEALASERGQGNYQKQNAGSSLACKPSIKKPSSQQVFYVVGNGSIKYLATQSCRKCYPTILPRTTEPHLQIVSFSSCDNNGSLAVVNVDSVFIPTPAAEQPQKQNKFISGEIAEQISVNNGLAATPDCFTKCVTPQLMVNKNESQFHGAKQSPTTDPHTMAIQVGDSKNGSPVASTVTCSDILQKQTNEHELTRLSDCFHECQDVPPCINSCDVNTGNATYRIYKFGNKQYDKPVAMAKRFISDANCNSETSHPNEVSKFSDHGRGNDSNDVSDNVQNWATNGTTSAPPVSASREVYSAEHSLSTTHGSHHFSPPVAHHSLDRFLESSYSCDAAAKPASVFSSVEERALVGTSNFSVDVERGTKSRPPCRYQALQTDMMASQVDASAPWTKLSHADESIISKEKKAESQQAWKGSEKHFAVSVNGQEETRNATYPCLTTSANTNFIAHAMAGTSDVDIQVIGEPQSCSTQCPSQASFQSPPFLQQLPSESMSHRTSCHRGCLADQTTVSSDLPCFHGKEAPQAVDVDPVGCSTDSTIQLHSPLKTRNIDCLPTIACQNVTRDQWTHELCELQSTEFSSAPLPLPVARSQDATKYNTTKDHLSNCSYNEERSFALEQNKQRVPTQKSKAISKKFVTLASSQQKAKHCKRKTRNLQKKYFLLLKGIFLSPCVDLRLLVETIVSTLSSENLKSFSKLFEEEMQKVHASATPLALTNNKKLYRPSFEAQIDGCSNECVPNVQAQNGCPTSETVVPSKASCTNPSASNPTQNEFKQPMSKRKYDMLHKLLEYRIKARRFFQTEAAPNTFHTLKDDEKEAMEELCCQMAQMVFTSSGSRTCLPKNCLDTRKMKLNISKTRRRFQMGRSSEEAGNASILMGLTPSSKLDDAESKSHLFYQRMSTGSSGNDCKNVRKKKRKLEVSFKQARKKTSYDSTSVFTFDGTNASCSYRCR